MYKITIAPDIRNFYLCSGDGIFFWVEDMEDVTRYVREFVEKGFFVVVNKINED